MDYFFNNSVIIERQNTGTALFNRLRKTALTYWCAPCQVDR